MPFLQEITKNGLFWPFSKSSLSITARDENSKFGTRVELVEANVSSSNTNFVALDPLAVDSNNAVFGQNFQKINDATQVIYSYGTPKQSHGVPQPETRFSGPDPENGPGTKNFPFSNF